MPPTPFSRSVLLVAFCSALACGGQIRRFPLADPLWVDGDADHLGARPRKYYSGINADGVDKLALRPLAHLFAFHTPGESVNVNALDEVPNSSWFQNRIGWFDLTPEEVARAECGDLPPLDPAGPWLVTGAKPDGANPGFFVEGPDGLRYLLKFDGTSQPLRATSADVIGSKLYWALGYHSVCNEIVEFDPSILVMAPGATAENQYGDDIPMTQGHIDSVLAKAFRRKDGTVRASSSRFVPGKPVGPFRYQGRRRDDPNDAIPHEDRRELRAAHLPAAWLNHVDAREQNTFDVLIDDGGRQYLRHYKLDWGDCLGLGWEPDRLARRFGYTYTLDYGHVGADLVTLGALDRPWHSAERTKVEIFGYYGVEGFVPSRWKPVYPIPAFVRRTPRDVMWMVRIMSRLTDDHLRAVVREARLPDERQSEYLTATLIGRRDRFFAEYLPQHWPVAGFRLVRRTPGDPRQSLCFEDLALQHGVASPDTVYYKLRFYGGARLDRQLGWLQFPADAAHPSYSCVVLPLGSPRPSEFAAPGAPPDDPMRYGVLRLWVHQGPTILPMSETRLHFYDLGPEAGYRLVGVERPEEIDLPDDY